VTRQISEHYNSFELKKHVIIVEKSTVPVGTCSLIRQILRENQSAFPQNKDFFHILSNPEFMSEGTSIFLAQRYGN
jgi:UDPglucose 6-dehydrogenase